MTGIIKTFLPEKQYGFIKGDDGKDYFFHQSDLKDRSSINKVCDGLSVAFEQKATPKGYSAIEIKIEEIDENKIKYIVPTSLEISKSDTFKDWEIVHISNLVLHGSSRNSPDLAKKNLIQHARTCGANAIINLEYYKTTGSEMSNSFNLLGTYNYTIHNFKGQLVNVGRRSLNGTHTKPELMNIEDRISNTTNNTDLTVFVWISIGVIVFFTLLLGMK